MSLIITRSDDTPVTGLSLTAERATASDPIDLKILNNGADDVVGAYLTLYSENGPGSGIYATSGFPIVDERMGRLQITGQDSTVTPGQEIVLGNVQPMGYLKVARLPIIKPGDWILADFWIEQSGASAGGGATNVKIEVSNERIAYPLPEGLSAVARGIISGRNEPKSFLITGRHTTATSGTPDDFVHLSPGSWLVDGREGYYTTINDIPMDQNDGAAAALAAGESYIAVLTQGPVSASLTKGLKATTPDRPTPIAGELILAWITVAYNASASVINDSDITEELLYGRYRVAAPPTGLSVMVEAGEAIIANFMQVRANRGLIVLSPSADNRVWLEWNGALTVTGSDDPPSAGAIRLAIVTTDATDITANVDTRVYIGGSVGEEITILDATTNDDIPIQSSEPSVLIGLHGVTTVGDLTGFIRPSFNQVLYVLNDDVGTITVKHLTGSAARDQVFCPGSVDFTLGPAEMCTWVGDEKRGVWRLVS